jgi:hypothetical protein
MPNLGRDVLTSVLTSTNHNSLIAPGIARLPATSQSPPSGSNGNLFIQVIFGLQTANYRALDAQIDRVETVGLRQRRISSHDGHDRR